MNSKAVGTLPRAAKGPIEAAPVVEGALRRVVDAVAGWPGVSTTNHWDLHDRSRVDGIDFYCDDDELGHVHLDGSIHLATDPVLGKALVAEGVARAFRYQRGWVEEQVERIGADAAIALFRRHYDRLRTPDAA